MTPYERPQRARKRSRRRSPEGSTEWVYIPDLAATLRCSRWTARNVVLRVKAVFGTDHVQKVERKGGPVDNAFGKTGGTYFHWPRAKQHSRKPDEMFALVERVSPGPYLEMFARRRRPGWAAMGDQVAA